MIARDVPFSQQRQESIWHNLCSVIRRANAWFPIHQKGEAMKTPNLVDYSTRIIIK